MLHKAGKLADGAHVGQLLCLLYRCICVKDNSMIELRNAEKTDAVLQFFKYYQLKLTIHMKIVLCVPVGLYN